MPIEVAVFGAGGHAKVVLDALTFANASMNDIRVIDENKALQGQDILGHRIEAPDPKLFKQGKKIHIAVGDGFAREAILLRLGIPKQQWFKIIHPKAVISSNATVDAGTFVAAGAIIGPGVKISEAVIVNNGAIIDHDCYVSNFATISPGSVVCGGVEIGQQVMIGASATLLPGIKIGDGAIIGAGAVVRTSVPAQEIWAGVPARKISSRDIKR